MVYGNYGAALILMALGAILHWAVTGHVSGIALGTIGVILLLTGLAWLLISAVYDFGLRRRAVDRTTIDRDRIVERERPLY